MRRNSYLSHFLIASLALAMAGCGSSTTNNKPKPTGLKKRVLLSNTAAGTVTVMDAQKDVLSTKVLGVTSPTKMLTAGGTTIVMDSPSSEITVIDNATEAVTFPSPIGDSLLTSPLALTAKTPVPPCVTLVSFSPWIQPRASRVRSFVLAMHAVW